jgi:hypothetical protein
VNLRHLRAIRVYAIDLSKVEMAMARGTISVMEAKVSQ